MLGMLSAFGNWLIKYEALALWLEGIALVLIFGLDLWREAIAATGA